MFSKKSAFLTPQQAEYLAASVMKDRLGFRDAKVTTQAGDGGIDVVSRKAVAQVKHWNSQIGRPAIQQLYGARGADTHKKLLFLAQVGTGLWLSSTPISTTARCSGSLVTGRGGRRIRR